MGIISAIGGLITPGKQKKIAKRQVRAAEAQAAALKERQRVEQVRANVEARRERREQLREARLRRAQVLSAAANAGALGASTVESGLGGIQTQFGANIGRINVAQGFGQAISTQNEIAAAQQSEINRLEGRSNVVAAQGQIFNSIGQLGQSIFNTAGGFTSIFGGNTFGG